ncbi:N-acetyltransferase [Chryseobacterium lactis]|uniref:N-acetyltransferase n=1 Tax=Chryseobacterium lactis TaxID=1241981 RepID=A0A3G6RS54_CHRLC|nr:GNAT family N-acetyltransferase [Chryseobacterium lactis]AZA85188.1 GNAT family N-acetyltransferase [Chryseobacterium lactis]AZB07138.1 GNAT family N-acetyltransferase [Chryseobacterium lactis]PNW12066.1 N-acetyltransferase [Chryseobacterium lactis]
MNIEYRKLLPEESKMYRKIRLESLEKFPEAFGANYQDALKIEKFRIEEDIENELPERFVFGAFSDGDLIGICTFVKDENQRGNLYQMYVKKDFQGKNIGYELIRRIINEIRGHFNDLEIFLEVAPHNEKAYSLYRKTGFKEVVNKTGGSANGSTMMQYFIEN